MPHPLNIVNHIGSASLHIEWDDGRHQTVSYLTLREACRCADCKAHAQRTGQRPEIGPGIALVAILPVGQYGVQLRFDDEHERGIYPWSLLASLQ